MATITAIKTIPHTRIENTIIANMADIGVYAYAVYSAIKMHLNQATGACFPSYALDFPDLAGKTAKKMIGH